MSESMVCCPLQSGDEEGPAVFLQRTIVARKPHTCTECGEQIQPKTAYEQVTGCWDHRWSTYKTCASCVEIRDHFACDNGWLFGQLWSDLADNFFPDMKAGGPCMEGLSPEAKGRLFERRMKWLEGRR